MLTLFLAPKTDYLSRKSFQLSSRKSDTTSEPTSEDERDLRKTGMSCCASLVSFDSEFFNRRRMAKGSREQPRAFTRRRLSVATGWTWCFLETIKEYLVSGKVEELFEYIIITVGNRVTVHQVAKCRRNPEYFLNPINCITHVEHWQVKLDFSHDFSKFSSARSASCFLHFPWFNRQ